MKAYIVYRQDNDRSRKLRQQLTNEGIEYQMIQSLSVEINIEKLKELHRGEAFYNDLLGRNLVLGEVAASYGHQKAVETFLRSDEQWGLILEDDARLELKNLPLSELITDEGNRQARLINIGGGTRIYPSPFQRSKVLTDTLVPTLLAHSYIINKKAATIYYQNFQRYGITSSPDWPYPHPPKIRFSCSRIAFFTQSDDDVVRNIGSMRITEKITSSESALSMPINLGNLIKRINKIHRHRFRYRDIVYHEVIKRIQVRIYLIITQCIRSLRTSRQS